MEHKAASPEGSADMMGRRRFLSYASGLLSAVIAAALGVPLVRLFIGNAFVGKPVRWLRVGPVSEMAVGEPQLVRASHFDNDGWRQLTRREILYVVTDDGEEFSVFSAACTHLGCPVRWDSRQRLFLCPCHNGAFSLDGTVAKGPPPKPLEGLAHKVERGTLYVRLG